MPAPATVAEFLELIPKSGVVEEARVAAYIQKLKTLTNTLPREPNKLAGMMVRDGLLTYFQAEQFLQGKWKRFTIGKYKVLERLGSGGMGQVFLCEHKLMRRRVAVKVLPTAKAEDPSSLDRFYREARAAAALDHQNIVRAYDIDQDDNLHFLVMEFVDGSSFQDIIKKTGPMDVLRACHYIYWSAIGMQHAHEQGIIHRDIKPGNILVDRQGVVKILDMGLARFFHDDEDLITKKYDENVLGTADYLAPEQALDSHTVDGRADIYSLGATFYFLLTAGPPFVEGTVAQKLIWHQNREPKPLKNVRADVPDGVVNIIAKMMAKDPANRFQSPAELAATLGPWIQTPIPPPPDNEMPNLCPAVIAAGTGMVSTSVAGKNPNTTSGTMVAPVPRKSSASSVHLAPLPAPPIGAGSGKQPSQMLPPTQKGNTSPVIVEPLPPSSPEAENDLGEQVWGTFADTNAVAEVTAERKPSSSHRKKAPPPKTPSSPNPAKKKTMMLWISIGAVVLAGAVGIILLVSGGGASSSGENKTNTGKGEPRTLTVSKKTPEDVAKLQFATVGRACDAALPKDRIVIQEEEWEEPLSLIGMKRDVTISGSEGKRVVWRVPSSQVGASSIFEVSNPETLTLRGIAFHAGNTQANCIVIKGRAAGLTIEDVELLEAKEFGLKFVDAVGDANRPIRVTQVRIASKETGAGISIQGSSPKQANAGVRQSAFLKIENCKFEGPFRIGAFQIEGQVADLEVSQCRIFNAASGIFVKRSLPDQILKLNFVNNTFHTLTGSLLRFEASEPLSQGAGKGKHEFGFAHNFFFNCANPLVSAGDNKPLPPLKLVGNGRNGGNDNSLATPLILDQVKLASDPANDATFLRSDLLKGAGQKNANLGASGP
jgi:serine/threonine protein kinase